MGNVEPTPACGGFQAFECLAGRRCCSPWRVKLSSIVGSFYGARSLSASSQVYLLTYAASMHVCLFREGRNMALDPKRTVAELKELRALTGDENGAERVAWTDTWLKAREWFAEKLTGLPVEHHCDAAGNSWVTLPGKSEKALLIGGHLDSVPNGGWLDGSLNVLAALEILRRISGEFGGK